MFSMCEFSTHSLTALPSSKSHILRRLRVCKEDALDTSDADHRDQREVDEPYTLINYSHHSYHAQFDANLLKENPEGLGR